MAEKEPVPHQPTEKEVVSEDKKRLEHLDEEIQRAEQEYRHTTHEDEPRFYDEGGEGGGTSGF
jgi:hypothetical protein